MLTQIDVVQARRSAQPDIMRLSAPMPPEFKRTTVSIFPLLDGDQLKSRVPNDRPPPKAWTAFVKALSNYSNLRIRAPRSTSLRFRSAVNRYGPYRAARRLAARGVREFGEVRLKDAERTLGEAIKTLIELRVHLIEKRFVAKLCLTRGQALLESKRPTDAEAAFQLALRLDPTVRMKSGYDHPKAVAAFDDARRSLLRRDDSPSLRNTSALTSAYSTSRRPTYYRWVGHGVYGRRDGQALEIVIDSPRGVQLERQRLTDSPEKDGELLASRVHATLPFGRWSRRKGGYLKVMSDVGFSGFAYLTSPVGGVPHYGVSSTFGLLVGGRLSLEANVQLSVSGRDFHEHLRENLTTLQLRLGGGIRGRSGRFGGAVHLGLSVDRLSEVVITTTPACKYFTPKDGVPRTLCDFERDFDRTEAAWSVGPSISIEGRFKLLDQLEFVTRVYATVDVFRTVEHGFAWPVGATTGLGYTFD